MSSERRNSDDVDNELPEYGVRSRNQHSQGIHRADPDSDTLEPACREKLADVEFKDAHIPTLTPFRRFSLCQNPECFGEIDVDESEDKELIADGGQILGHYERDDDGWPSAFPGIGVGAVLYEDRLDTPDDERQLYHVVDILISIETTDVYFVIDDGTHTTRQRYHEKDLLADFEPAGWRWPRSRKPTYWLTRQCGVDDKTDLMTDGGIDRSEDDEAVEPIRIGDDCIEASDGYYHIGSPLLEVDGPVDEIETLDVGVDVSSHPTPAVRMFVAAGESDPDIAVESVAMLDPDTARELSRTIWSAAECLEVPDGSNGGDDR